MPFNTWSRVKLRMEDVPCSPAFQRDLTKATNGVQRLAFFISYAISNTFSLWKCLHPHSSPDAVQTPGWYKSRRCLSVHPRVWSAVGAHKVFNPPVFLAAGFCRALANQTLNTAQPPRRCPRGAPAPHALRALPRISAFPASRGPAAGAAGSFRHRAWYQPSVGSLFQWEGGGFFVVFV